MFKEYVFRLIQHCFSLFIFDTPGLRDIKSLFYRLFLTIGKKSYIGYNSFLVAHHRYNDAKLTIENNVAITKWTLCQGQSIKKIRCNISWFFKSAACTPAVRMGFFARRNGGKSGQASSYRPLVYSLGFHAAALL